jgi:dienelactone hydrolase
MAHVSENRGKRVLNAARSLLAADCVAGYDAWRCEMAHALREVASMPRNAVLLAGLILMSSSRLLEAAEADDSFLAAALKRTIVDSGLPLAEVQDFAEAHVPLMPEVTSVAEWEAKANQMRAAALARVIFRGEAAAWRDAKTRVEWLGAIDSGPGYKVKKLRYEALPGLWIPALLYEPDRITGKVPVILNVNGHERAAGKAVAYEQIRCINLAKRGMLALHPEWLGMGQLNSDGYDHGLINAIDLCGTSGIATHYLALTRGLDILLAHEHADPARVAVTGLSGGGWQTIFVSAFDTRVTLSDPVAGYSSFRTRVRHFSDLGDSEQTPCDLATVTDYAQMTAMMAPRPTLLTFNIKDNCCFASGHALPPLFDAAASIFALYHHGENLRTHINEDPGTHNYDLDNRLAFYRMVGDFFYAGDAQFDPTEIPCSPEVKSKDELSVELPDDNADFHTLALALSRSLPRPRHSTLPGSKSDLALWRSAGRDRLSDIVRASDDEVEAKVGERETKDDLTATFWTLKMGDSWSVPAVELVGCLAKPKATVIVIADAGRKAAVDLVQAQLTSGARVLAIDPFSIGELQIARYGYLFSLLVSAEGYRPLGIQSSQLAAVARWAHAQYGDPVTLVADGPRTCLAALVAAATAADPHSIAGLELHHSLGSLKEPIEERTTYGKAPEYFCFGLLEWFDIKHIVALAAPRPVRFVDSSDRVKSEMASIQDWYPTLGGTFEPPK